MRSTALLLALGCGTAFAQPVALHNDTPWPARELSGLAWDGARGELMSVSDRGHWLRWRLDTGPDGHWRATAVAGGPLGPPRVNAEAVTWQAGPPAARGWLVADENRHRVLRLDPDGRPRDTRALPAGLPPRGRGHGVEALAWHPRHGLIAALQQPRAGWHELHADDGWSCRVPATPGGRSALKDMQLLDTTRLLLLERLQDAGTLRTLLRPVDLADCGKVLPPVAVPGGGLNHEGLACPDARHCLVVSDDGAGAGGTHLLRVALP